MKIAFRILLMAGLFFFGFVQAKSGSIDYQSNTAEITVSGLNGVFDNYFELKDALVKTDATAAGSKAASLVTALKSVNERSLSTDEAALWKKLKDALLKNSEKIAKSKDIAEQRAVFKPLSEDFYTLAKGVKYGQTLYYQYCPMYDGDKGGKWLSKEKKIQNPYFGSKMMTCGRVVDTLD